MADQMYLPTLSHWEYGNEWSGERGQARFLILPAEGQMNVEMWRGPMSREFAQVQFTAQFPISDAGIEDMRSWLVEQAEQINRAPVQG